MIQAADEDLFWLHSKLGMIMNILPYLKNETVATKTEDHTHTVANVRLTKESCFRGSLIASPHS